MISIELEWHRIPTEMKPRGEIDSNEEKTRELRLRNLFSQLFDFMWKMYYIMLGVCVCGVAWGWCRCGIERKWDKFSRYQVKSRQRQAAIRRIHTPLHHIGNVSATDEIRELVKLAFDATKNNFWISLLFFFVLFFFCHRRRRRPHHHHHRFDFFSGAFFRCHADGAQFLCLDSANIFIPVRVKVCSPPLAIPFFIETNQFYFESNFCSWICRMNEWMRIAKKDRFPSHLLANAIEHETPLISFLLFFSLVASFFLPFVLCARACALCMLYAYKYSDAHLFVFYLWNFPIRLKFS